MDTFYQPFHKQAVDLQYKFHDMVDDPNHPEARALQHEIHQLVEDIESSKHPRAIEDRVKVIQRQLDQTRLRNAPKPVLNHNENQAMYHSYEQMRHDLRQLPHF
jgi:hypothetical protein